MSAIISILFDIIESLQKENERLQKENERLADETIKLMRENAINSIKKDELFKLLKQYKLDL